MAHHLHCREGAPEAREVQKLAGARRADKWKTGQFMGEGGREDALPERPSPDTSFVHVV